MPEFGNKEEEGTDTEVLIISFSFLFFERSLDDMPFPWFPLEINIVFGVGDLSPLSCVPKSQCSNRTFFRVEPPNQRYNQKRPLSQ